VAFLVETAVGIHPTSLRKGEAMNGISVRYSLTRPRIAALALGAVTASLALSTSSAAEVGLPGSCPDSQVPTLVLATSVPNGAKKDRNGNGWVCVKFDQNGKVAGGPDDDVFV
jgi:hypothetical protein